MWQTRFSAQKIYNIYKKRKMQQVSNTKHNRPARMQSALQHAFSQPRRNPKPSASYQIDPQWQQKVGGGSSKNKTSSTVFLPTHSAGMQQAGNGGYKSGGMGGGQRNQTPRIGQTFDAKGFLNAQRKGEFRNKNRQAGAPLAQQQLQQQQQQKQLQQQNQGKKSQKSRVGASFQQASAPPMTLAQATNAFDIERFKAMQPRKTFKSPAAPEHTERQKTLLEKQRQIQASNQHRQIKPGQMEMLKKQQQNATAVEMHDENEIVVDEQQFAEQVLPWQAANQNYAARVSKAANSKDVLQQFATLQQNASLHKVQKAPPNTPVAAQANHPISPSSVKEVEFATNSEATRQAQPVQQVEEKSVQEMPQQESIDSVD